MDGQSRGIVGADTSKTCAIRLCGFFSVLYLIVLLRNSPVTSCSGAKIPKTDKTHMSELFYAQGNQHLQSGHMRKFATLLKLPCSLYRWHRQSHHDRWRGASMGHRAPVQKTIQNGSIHFQDVCLQNTSANDRPWWGARERWPAMAAADSDHDDQRSVAYR